MFVSYAYSMSYCFVVLDNLPKCQCDAVYRVDLACTSATEELYPLQFLAEADRAQQLVLVPPHPSNANPNRVLSSNCEHNEWLFHEVMDF